MSKKLRQKKKTARTCNFKVESCSCILASLTVFPPNCCLTNSLADSCGRIHLVAVVAFALVSSFQIYADLTADARVQTLIDIYIQRETGRREGGEEEKTEGIQLVSDMFN